MGFLTSAIQSALTPQGWNDKLSQQNQQKLIANGASNAASGLAGSLLGDANYSASLDPARRSDLNNLLLAASPGNNAARAQTFKNNAYENAAVGSKIADNADNASGLSPAFQAGQNQAIANNAQASVNQFQAQQASPEAQLQQAQALGQMYQQAMGMPELSNYSQLANLVYQRPGVMVQPGLGQTLGGIAGSIAGNITPGGSGKSSDDGDGDGS